MIKNKFKWDSVWEVKSIIIIFFLIISINNKDCITNIFNYNIYESLVSHIIKISERDLYNLFYWKNDGKNYIHCY